MINQDLKDYVWDFSENDYCLKTKMTELYESNDLLAPLLMLTYSIPQSIHHSNCPNTDLETIEVYNRVAVYSRENSCFAINGD